MLFTLREARRLLAIILVPVVVGGYVIYSFAPTPPDVVIVGERVRAIAVRSPYDQRSQIYHEALNEIRADPITGVGPGGFAISSRRAGTATSTVFAEHAHNMLLNYGAESGLPAVGLVLAFCLALGAAARRGARAAGRIDRRHRALILSIGASLFAIFVQGFFDYTLGNPVIRITVWMLIGALLVAVREADRLPLTSPVRTRQRPV
jgi:O-antigen ligase